ACVVGCVIGVIVRGICVGAVVTVLSLFFSSLHIQHIGITVTMLLLTSLLFSLAGFINAVYANNFDDISIVPTFVLTPLTYLGGVFYSIDRKSTRLNSSHVKISYAVFCLKKK